MDHLENYLDILKSEKKHSANTIQAYAGDLRRFCDFL
ncbi:MAG: site-specific integrase, partial [Bacteroidales bacterium]|nr:site-specific integrase [Bacteroidales bacterium]